jgi:hypothetical protein
MEMPSNLPATTDTEVLNWGERDRTPAGARGRGAANNGAVADLESTQSSDTLGHVGLAAACDGARSPRGSA